MNLTDEGNTTVTIWRNSLPIEDKYILLCVCLMIILLGVVGNGCILLAVTRVREMRRPIYYCLTSLCISDTLVLLITPVWPLTNLFQLRIMYVGQEFCHFAGFFDRGALVSSLLTVLALSIDRYVAVCYPLRARQVLSKKTTLAVLFSIWGLSIAVSAPYATMSAYHERDKDGVNVTLCGWDMLPWQLKYDTAVFCIFILLPMICLLVFNVLIVRTLLRTATKTSVRSEYSVSHARKNRQVAFMVTGIVLSLWVCLLPTFIYQNLWKVCDLLLKTTGLCGNTITIIQLSWFFRILVLMNSAGNPIIYSVVSSEFRASLKKAIRIYPRGDKSGTNHLDMASQRLTSST